MSNVSTSIRKQARALGQRALDKMDPLCEEHLRTLEYHPVDAEFSNTPIYREFEGLVADHAEEQGYDWEDCDAMLRDELRWEVREAFDEGFYNPSNRVECVGCLEDGDIQIRVNDAESITADSILDGKSQSGNVKDDKNDWR